jgi:hypothetical protein
MVDTHIRFSVFATERRKSILSKSEKGGGIFKSVEVATEQIEEMRLLAERAMFLVTRLTLLIGLFADTWLSKLLANRDIKTITIDLHQFSLVSERLTVVAEELPEKIAQERQDAIR